jgi:hypothetical protein
MAASNSIAALCGKTAHVIVSRIACEACQENTARYISIDDEAIAFTCGTCPVKHGWESIRISDLAPLFDVVIKLVRAERVTALGSSAAIDELRSILGRKP